MDIPYVGCASNLLFFSFCVSFDSIKHADSINIYLRTMLHTATSKRNHAHGCISHSMNGMNDCVTGNWHLQNTIFPLFYAQSTMGTVLALFLVRIVQESMPSCNSTVILLKRFVFFYIFPFPHANETVNGAGVRKKIRWENRLKTFASKR